MNIFKSKKLYALLTLILLATLSIYLYQHNNSMKKISTPPPTTTESSTSSYYSSLYGTWSVTKHIPSKIKTTLSDSMISFCINQKFTIEKDEITSLMGTITNPQINEGTMTASDFSKKYNDTLENLGISGDSIKYVYIKDTSGTNHSVTFFTSNDGKTYALLGGALFELERQ